MRSRSHRYSCGLVGILFLVSCESWNDNTKKRFDDAMKIACDTIRAVQDGIKTECGQLSVGTLRDLCVMRYTQALAGMRAAKVDAAGAYVYCDSAALKKALKNFEKAVKLIDWAYKLVKPFIAAAGHKSNINVTSAGSANGSTYTYTISAASTVVTQWGNNAQGQPVNDTLNATGTIVSTITPAGGGTYNVAVSQLGVTLSCPPGSTTCFNDGTTISVTSPPGGFSMVASPNSQVYSNGYKATYEGKITGSMSGVEGTLDFKIKLNFYFSSSLLQMKITTLGLVSSTTVFTATGAGTDRYWDLYYANPLIAGSYSSIVLEHVAPNKTVEFYVATTLGPATQTFNGAAWDLSIAGQTLIDTVTSDANGFAATAYQPSASSAGEHRFFQAIVYLSPGVKSTYVVGTEVSRNFRRGDANDDSNVDIGDATYINSFLFQGGAAPVCLDAADSNDDGGVDLSDSVYLLTWLYSGGTEPPSPGPYNCGSDPSPDGGDSTDFQLGCVGGAACP